MRLSQFLSLQAPVIVKVAGAPRVLLAFGVTRGFLIFGGKLVGLTLDPVGGVPRWIDADRLEFPAPIQGGGPVMKSEKRVLS